MAPILSSFLLAFTAEKTSHGMEYPFGQFWSAVLAMFPPKILPIPNLLDGGEMLGDTTDAVQALLSSSQNTDVLPTPSSLTEQCTTLRGLL